MRGQGKSFGTLKGRHSGSVVTGGGAEGPTRFVKEVLTFTSSSAGRGDRRGRGIGPLNLRPGVVDRLLLIVICGRVTPRPSTPDHPLPRTTRPLPPPTSTPPRLTSSSKGRLSRRTDTRFFLGGPVGPLSRRVVGERLTSPRRCVLRWSVSGPESTPPPPPGRPPRTSTQGRSASSSE